MFNLDIYPIHINEGSVEETLPGLITLAPPRKCGRGRESDQLIALIHLTGKTNITPEALETWLQKKAALFYSAPGSVTNAMRLMAEAINNELLDRNLKKAVAGSQVNGSLSLAVLRKDMVYSLVIGQARVFLITKEEVFEQADRSNHVKGLGVTQSITCLFGQHQVASGDSILLSPLPSPHWSSDSLQNAATLKADALGRRLLNQRPPDLRATLVRLGEGKGLISVKSLFPSLITEAVEQKAAASVEENEGGENYPEISSPATQVAGEYYEETPLDFPGMDKAGTQTVDDNIHEYDRGEIAPARLETVNVTSRRDEGSEPDSIRRRKPARERSTERKSLFANTKNEPKPKKQKAYDPDAVSVPRSLYLVLAIAVPIIVVIIAFSVWINQGRSQRFAYYMGEGERYAQEAELASDDPVAYSFNLQAAMMFLEKANQYGATEESNALLTSVQAQLDKLQGVVRLSMTPFVSDVKTGNVNITQMVATNTDLYMLDSLSGKALHYELLGDEYVLDHGFDCGPNPNNPLNSIGKLVDIVGLPAGNSFGARLFGIDAYGNIEFCVPGESGVISSLIAPDAGWQEIKGISMHQNYLYVMDPGNNAVFTYYRAGILFEEKPWLFFDNQIPDMELAVDFEVVADEMYILRSNGEMVECTYSHLKDYKLTECTDPAPYHDTRSGQTTEIVNFGDSRFVQMRITPAPDSSIYLMDAHGNGIYHFSLLRNLQKILQPGFSDLEYSPKKEVTSVAVSPGRRIFLAFGDRIYTATMP